MTLILASGSPRRREILAELGLQFEVQAADIDESLKSGESPKDYVLRLAKEKAIAVAMKNESAFVVGADTSVVVDGDVLGKPADEEEAFRMVQRLVGREHSVITGVALVRVVKNSFIPNGFECNRSICEESLVTFRAADQATVRRYAQSKEGLDKAGAYAVQGLGMGLVERIVGSYSNVVGLPAAQTLALLLECGVLASWPSLNVSK